MFVVIILVQLFIKIEILIYLYFIMSQSYILYPPIKTEQKINQFKVEVSQLLLFQSVSLNVILYDADDKFVCVKSYRLEGDDYTAWSDDDKYIVDFVREQLKQESNN
jgi:hypothetical protein